MLAKDYEVIHQISDERTESGKRILIKIHLETGRHHQIRVQMAHAGMPLLGDRKYNPGEISQLPLGLCSCHLIFRHPITGKKMEFQVLRMEKVLQVSQIRDFKTGKIAVFSSKR